MFRGNTVEIQSQEPMGKATEQPESAALRTGRFLQLACQELCRHSCHAAAVAVAVPGKNVLGDSLFRVHREVGVKAEPSKRCIACAHVRKC